MPLIVGGPHADRGESILEIVGYADRFSVHPGETIRFMVSSQNETYGAGIVRLIHGDENPLGPGYRDERIPTAIDGEYPGKFQPIRNGSYVTVEGHDDLDLTGSFTLQAWIFPTTADREQTIIGRWSEEDATGYRLMICGDGSLGISVGDGSATETISTGTPLRNGVWCFAAACYDADEGKVTLYQLPITMWPQEPSRAVIVKDTGTLPLQGTDGPLTMAAHLSALTDGKPVAHGKYNGKIDSPRIYAGALTEEEIGRLRRDAPPAEVGDGSLRAAWTFSTNFSTDVVDDISGRGHVGRAVNRPYRAMTGHLWRGQEQNFRIAPELYGAMYFHDDDLDDAGWDVDFELTVPETMRSGIYAAHLTAGDSEDHVPFFVRAPRGTSTAPALFLVPTNSYLSYANIHIFAYTDIKYVELGRLAGGKEITFDYPVDPRDLYMIENKLRSQYDRHSDNSGVSHSSRLRPILNMRPKYHSPLLHFGRGAPHQFNADLHLTDWLEQMGHDFDVATDEDLQREGVDLLRRYRVVLTGSHPEYWTSQGLDALEDYLREGGRHMYLGGNGYYWVTSFAADSTHCIEVRRHRGTEAWEAAAGEYYHQSTGELGGLWRFRGRAPQELVGVGFTSQGFDVSLPYQMAAESADPRAAFIVDGLTEGESFGAYGLTQGGASGFEIDRADAELGTPPHALVLATTEGFSDVYQHVIEEVLLNDGMQGGTVNPLVRGDIVFYEGPNGGAVFSVGSISWCGALSHNDYDNDVSRMTDNVLRRFISEEEI